MKYKMRKKFKKNEIKNKKYLYMENILKIMI